MPSSITHHLIAESAKQILSPELWQTASAAPDYFFLGAQGPDLFFFLKPQRGKKNNFGRMLHRTHIYAIFSSLRESVEKFSGEAHTHALAYCLGYISHYSADAVFHPPIYRYLEGAEHPSETHRLIENDWDVYFARTRAGREAQNYNFPYSPRKIAQEGVLFRLFRCVTDALSLPPFSPAALRHALVRFGKFLSFFHKNCYARRRRFEKFERLFHLHGLASCYPRETPDPETIAGEAFYGEGLHEKSADELFDRAVYDSARRMELFHASEKGLPREEFSLHLLTGEPT